MCRSDEFNVHAMSVVCLLVSSRGHNIHLIGLIRSDNSALAIHSLVNSWALIEIRDYYYSWIRLRVRHSSANGAPPQFLSDPSSCDSVLTPPCSAHYTELIEYSSHPITRPVKSQIICNFVRLLQPGQWSSLPLAVITRRVMIHQSELSIARLWPIRGQLVRSKIGPEWSWYWPHHLDQFLLTSRS